MNPSNHYDVVILGAGASGLVCAAEAAKRKRRTIVLDNNKSPGAKILMSGGGKCNFTNYSIDAANYIGENPHFCKSALSRYTQWDFLSLVEKHGIPWVEREHGQLFCLRSARDINDLLTREVRDAGAILRSSVEISLVRQKGTGGYTVETGRGTFTADSLVVATGGLSYPSAGAGPLGYRIAQQFGIPLTPLSAGLVPLTLTVPDKARFSPLSGIAIDAEVEIAGARFRGNLLFTHRGLSGPVILQISNYRQPGSEIQINLLPERSTEKELIESSSTDRSVQATLSQFLPKRLVASVIPEALQSRKLKTLIAAEIIEISALVHRLTLRLGGDEGYRSAEITRGGVSTRAISSKTFEATAVPGLYFIGEVLDVSGWLGGYNLQWAWSSGWCAGQYV